MPRHKSYTVEYKLAAIDYLNHTGGNVSQTAKEFGVDRKRIREWRDQRETLVQHQVGREKKKRKLHPGRDLTSIEVDHGVLVYLENERAEGRVVRNKDLQAKAMEIAHGLNLQGFVASPMWMKRWKCRNSITTRRGTQTSQRIPIDFDDQLFNYRINILRLRFRNGYRLHEIQNMDQTMVRFDMPPSRTNNQKGPKQVRIKTTNAQKRGFTVALYVAADGTKFPAMIVFKERNGEIPQRARRLLWVPGNVRITATANGWMTRETVVSWIQRLVGDLDDRRLLILDSYRAHQTAEVRDALEERNIDLVFVPGGCTGLAQPVDIGIAKPFKDYIRDSWVEWMQEPRPLTPAGNLTQPTRQDVIDWVSAAWDKLSPATIRTCFLRCAISNALDGTEDDQTLEWFPDEIAGVLPHIELDDNADVELDDDGNDSGDDMDEDDVDFIGFGDED